MQSYQRKNEQLPVFILSKNYSWVEYGQWHYSKHYCSLIQGEVETATSSLLNLFSVNIHVHQKPSSAIFREGIRLWLVYRVRVSFR